MLELNVTSHRDPLETRRTGGFTLVELLVVIAVIGILTALLLPAVFSVRESGRRTTCRNHLRQVVLAAQQYSLARDGLLPALWRTDRPNTWENFAWRASLLPYLEQQAVYDRLVWQALPLDTVNAQAVSTVIESWQCPSTPGSPRLVTELGFPSERTRPFALGASDYTAVFEVRTPERDFPLRGVWNGGPDLQVTLPPPERLEPMSDTMNPQLRTRPGNLHDIPDGTSYTVLILEQAGKPQHFGPAGSDMAGEPTEGAWATAELSTFYGQGINRDNFTDPYSFHYGVHIAMCDASVHFLDAQISAQIVRALLTRDGREIMNDSDWR